MAQDRDPLTRDLRGPLFLYLLISSSVVHWLEVTLFDARLNVDRFLYNDLCRFNVHLTM